MPLGVEVGLGTGHIALDGDPGPSSPTQKWAYQPPFSAHMSNVAKRSPISATA